jgi:prepilin-type N-terminal cleavage/methylation domain-containing protein
MKTIFKKKINNLEKGFSLVELMVAMSIFILVLTISSGSILNIFNANQKSKSLRSVMDNLNTTLESMTRTIRFSINYHCGSTGTLTSPQNCGGAGSNTLVVTASNGATVKYSLVNGRIVRTIGGVDSFLTSPDVNITNLTFRVYGADPYPDLLQPQVIIVIGGVVSLPGKSSVDSTFTLETTVTQRIFDFQ